MLKLKILAKSSEEFLWAFVAGSIPLRNEPTFDFQVGHFHGRSLHDPGTAIPGKLIDSPVPDGDTLLHRR